MKKISLFIIGILIFPAVINAETITYNVCESGCEYSTIQSVANNVNSLENPNDKDIIININGEYLDSSRYYRFGDRRNILKSLVVNGNNHSIDEISIYAKTVEINRINISGQTFIANADMIKVNNSNIEALFAAHYKDVNYPSTEERNVKDFLIMDNASFNNVKVFGFSGNKKIDNMNFRNKAILNFGGLLSIYNSQLTKVLNFFEEGSGVTNIYNSTFDSLRYINPKSGGIEVVEFGNFIDSRLTDPSVLISYDVYDFYSPSRGKITIYFDKEFEINPGEEIDLNNALDYYTSGKAIDYKINNEDIAKIENMKLKGLTGGKTRLTITTDDGHIVYRIWLKVKKEKVAKKISKMVVKIPITGKKIKVWVIAVSLILLGIVSGCVYMLIKRKK